ncbi:hypothetical protein [Cardiobacterium valvarum]|uniref:hypothetical protein n=1 Tax=Cardiobacterium valvarum TaxID=194702 RepID=UPI0011C06FA4|nr:hypothetical protein [Cardiobacterium valvarum]
MIYIKIPIGFPLDSRYGSRCAGNKINGVPAVFAVLASGVRVRDAILSDFLPLQIAHILSMFTCLPGRISGHPGDSHVPARQHHSTAAAVPPKHK